MTLCSRFESISLKDFLVEVEKAAVEKQSDMLNVVRVWSPSRKRNEPVRKFLARLNGLAN